MTQICKRHGFSSCGLVGRSSTVVYRVRKDEQDFALKVSDEAYEGVQNIAKEFAFLSRLDHRCIVKAYLFRQESNAPACVLMEFANGPTLQRLLQKNYEFTGAELVSIAHDLCDALGHAHECDLVHRDVSLDNLIYHLEQSRLYVIDWNYGLGLTDSDSACYTTGQTMEIVTPYFASMVEARGWNTSCVSSDACDSDSESGPDGEVLRTLSAPSALSSLGEAPRGIFASHSDSHLSEASSSSCSYRNESLSPYGKRQYRAPENEQGSYLQQDAYAAGVVLNEIGASAYLADVVADLMAPLEARITVLMARDRIEEVIRVRFPDLYKQVKNSWTSGAF
jgi:serine/threonine protein kinase